MVHPSELLRSNTQTFSAPRAEYQLDCGIRKLPILNKCCNLERFAKPQVFLIFLSLVGFLQGVSLSYFRETARIWGKHYNISQEHIDWLIYTNEFFIGFVALFVAYYGNKIHRITWIGGLTIYQAISSATLVIPEIYRTNYKEENFTEPYLCNSTIYKNNENQLNYIAIAILVIYQIFFAMAYISFISHGITYLDDNTSTRTSSGYIGIALASQELGKQAGIYLSWIPYYIKVNAVFISPMWLITASMVFLSGIFISMFPKSMPAILIRILSVSLVNSASGHESRSTEQIVDGFFKTVFRLLKNKILMVNIFCNVFIQSGLINFDIFEKYFNQTSFYVSKLNDTSYTQFATNLLKQPLVAISLIAAGFLAAKTKPHLKSLIKWNIAAIIVVIILFASTTFLRCEPHTKHKRMLQKIDNCNCSYNEFQPVCVKSTTYYSPCFAGCRNYTTLNSRRVYHNCLKSEAVEGPCNEEKCNMFYALFQINRVFTTALLATTLVTSLIINMRCILARDKATALGLHVTFVALIAYLPVRAIYGTVAEHYCLLFENKSCALYSKKFATFLSLCTMGFMIVSLILAIILLILLKLKSSEEKQDDDSIELNNIEPSREENRLMNEITNDLEENNKSDSANSIPDSLLEMENVGDDHDSIDSSCYLDDPRTRINRKRVMRLESDL